MTFVRAGRGVALVGVAATCCSVALGCNSGDKDKGDQASTTAKTTTAKTSEQTQKRKKDGAGAAPKPAKPVRAPGRSPGVPASEPKYVGQYSVRVSKSQSKALGAPPGTAGTWELRLTRGGYNVFASKSVVTGRLQVAGSRMVFRQRGACGIPDPHKALPKRLPRRLGAAGTYRWTLDGRSLRLHAVSDSCGTRRDQFSTLRWQLER